MLAPFRSYTCNCLGLIWDYAMNKFSKVFEAIEVYHDDTDSINQECYSFISGYANVPLNKLKTYFRTLQKLNLIKYDSLRSTRSHSLRKKTGKVIYYWMNSSS